MKHTLPELIKDYPIGARITIQGKRDDYQYGKFIVQGYLYDIEGWHPAHQLNDTEWEIYLEE